MATSAAFSSPCSAVSAVKPTRSMKRKVWCPFCTRASHTARDSDTEQYARSLGEVLAGDLLEHVLGPERHRAERLGEPVPVELGLREPAAREPVKLAVAESQPVVVGGEGENLAASGRGGPVEEQRELQPALRAAKVSRVERLVLRDGADLVRGPQERHHLVAELARETLVDALGE